MRTATLSFLAMMLMEAGSASAQIIEKVSSLQPVSIATLKANPLYRGKKIDWSVVCTTIDESSSAFAVVGDTARNTGDSVQVRLIKYDLKYTYYTIVASSGSARDSLQLQVFSKGAMQKYLYRIPIYSSRPVPVYIYLPPSFSSSSPLLVVMHGIDRNALSYGLAWTSFASANNTVLLAPEFNATDWSTSAYTQGNIFTGSDGAGSLNVKERWTFTIVKDIERTLLRGFGLKDSLYTIWGHSAGAQFVHRMVLFAADPMAKTAIAANAGWYTAPDTTTIFPWGVKNPFLSIQRQDLVDYTLRNLVIMRGTADTLRDSDLNVDSLSDVQGRNRYLRAGFFFQKGTGINPGLRWLLLDVLGSGHDYRKMATAAGEFLVKGATAVQRVANALPQDMLLQNYPNPFNPSTTIAFSIHRPSRISIGIFSVLGEQLQTIVEGNYVPGTYKVTFDGTHLASGIYFCRMTDEMQSSVIKLLLLK
jgi:hypothetical protein